MSKNDKRKATQVLTSFMCKFLKAVVNYEFRENGCLEQRPLTGSSFSHSPDEAGWTGQ